VHSFSFFLRSCTELFYCLQNCRMYAPHDTEAWPHSATSGSACLPTTVCSGSVDERESHRPIKTTTTPKCIVPVTSKPSDTESSLASSMSAFQPPTSATSFQAEQDKESFACVITIIFCYALWLLCFRFALSLFYVLGWPAFTVKTSIVIFPIWKKEFRLHY